MGGRWYPLPVDGAWLTRRYVTDLASIRDIAGELDLPQSAVLQALIRHGIPRRPLGTPKGLPSREEQVACLRQVAVQELQRILVEADTESGAATALGVSQIVLTEVVADAGIDREQVARERRARKRIVAWPVLLRDRDVWPRHWTSGRFPPSPVWPGAAWDSCAPQPIITTSSSPKVTAGRPHGGPTSPLRRWRHRPPPDPNPATSPTPHARRPPRPGR